MNANGISYALVLSDAMYVGHFSCDAPTLTRYTSMGVVFKCKGNGSVEKKNAVFIRETYIASKVTKLFHPWTLR